MNKDILRILYTEDEIKTAVSRVGRAITDDYKDKNPIFIGILKGSVVFMADLLRTIDLECQIDFMVAQSYGDNAYSSGIVKIKKDIDTDIKDRHVILVEDILDTARTLHAVVHTLRDRNPASIKICTLLDKKVKKAELLVADYKCFDVENEFLVGYGLDYSQSYRNLPYIGVLKPEIYIKN